MNDVAATDPPTDAAAIKRRLRREALARRDAVPETARIEAALALATHVDALEADMGAVVGAYWPIRSEVDPRPLVFALHERGCRMALPAMTDERMAFRELTRTSDLVPSGFGTHAPAEGAPELVPGLILMPLAAFDARGNRIGYGRGHYDRAVAALHAAGHTPRLIGLALDVQEVDAVPAEPHDMPLDGVLLPGGLRATAGVTAEANNRTR